MRLSAKAEYACMAALALARAGNDGMPVRIGLIAETYGIPKRYLVQILLQLKGAGLVHSARGSSGGYLLSRPPDRIMLGEVLGAIDGPGEPPRPAREPTAKALAAVLEKARAAEKAVLDRTSLAQVLSQTDATDWII